MVCKSATSVWMKKVRLQEIVELGNPDQVPLDIAILFDISSSVSQKGFFAFQQKAAASFLKQVLKPVDRAAVFTIADEPKLVSPLQSAELAAARILTIPAASAPVPTAFYDTVTGSGEIPHQITQLIAIAALSWLSPMEMTISAIWSGT